MSHYVVGIVLPFTSYTGEREIEDYLTMVMWRYDENRRVPDYDDDCGCAGARVRRQVAEVMLERFGNFDEKYRKPWNERISQHEDMLRHTKTWREDMTPKEQNEYFSERTRLRDQIDVEMGGWKAHTELYRKTEEQLWADHPWFGEADPECRECSGTGTIRISYNPEGKWDWYAIGGRWDGFMGAQQDICEEGDHFPYEQKFQQLGRNICTVGELLTRVKADPDQKTFALLTSEWYEQASMGWFGTTSGEKTENEWQQQYLEILRGANSEQLVVGVDCHI